MREIAHFFWKGTLSNLEISCIKSFIKNGFDVNIWSFDGTHIDGATSRDANEVLPESFLNKITVTENNVYKNITDWAKIAVFADVFRLHVLQKEEGWWFDTDCYCLKDQDEFRKMRQGHSIIVGNDDLEENIVANGVLYCNKHVIDILVREIDDKLEKNNYHADKFIMYGPTFLIETLHKYQIYDTIVPHNYFYSIQGGIGAALIDPEKTKELKTIIKDSYVSHVWKPQIADAGVDKNNPPEGSLLWEFYNGYENNEEQNYEHNKAFENNTHRLIEISKLYWKILKRAPDHDGLSNYINSNLPLEIIQKDLYMSDEYK